MLDVRIPIAWLFSIFGIILVVYGAVHPLPVELTRGNNVNLNLYWGLLMLGFGLFMAALIKLDAGKKAE